MADDDDLRLPIRGFMARAFDGRAVGDDDDIFALGFANSLFAMQLVAFVEGRFAIEIDSDDLEMDNFRSIAALARLVARKTAAGR
jgi:acyl carrier protein